jgi:hypothetical protein
MEKFTKLIIFDLDGTLLDTPLPDSGKVIYKEKTGEEWPHKGWWSQPMSLNLEIFDIPTVPMVIDAYNEHKKCDKTCKVMLTGRIVKLGDLVKEILKVKELEFDEYHFNYGGSTEESKIKTMEKLLIKYPNIKEMIMFDDRLEHIPIFQTWGDNLVKTGRLDEFKINVVPADRH